MSSTSLRKVLQEVAEKLETYSDKIDPSDPRGKRKLPAAQFHNDRTRRDFSARMNSHTINFSVASIKKGTLEVIADKKLPNINPSKLESLATELNNALKAHWKVSGDSHTVNYDKDNKIDIYRNLFDAPGYKTAILNFNRAVSLEVGSESIAFVDAGHVSGFGVGDTALLSALVHTNNLDAALKFREVVTNHTIKMFLSKIPQIVLDTRNGKAFEFHLEVELEGKTTNRSTAAKLNYFKEREQGFIKRLREQALKILEDKNWADVQGSPSITQEAIQIIIDAAKGVKTKRKTKKTQVSRQRVTRIKTKESTGGIPGINVVGKRKPNPRDWLSMIGAINARLPEVVRGNMGEPGLVNRTGRFAGSTRVTTIQTTPQGFPSIGYTYDKTPYGVFDRRLGALPWATPERDPGLVIEKSIREIVASLAIGRFYLRRE